MSEVLTVFGATGNQGGSVIRYVQANSALAAKYKIRGVTRDPSKESGKKLAASGVEVVAGNADDPSTLAGAVAGSSVVFAVTNFWETQSYDIELAQGKAIADAAKAAGVKHIIFSSLSHATKTSNGKYTHVLHFDSKADIESYIRTLGINCSFVQLAAFMSNFLGQILNSKSDAGYSFALPFGPDDSMPMMDPSETGKWVVGMLLKGEEIYGKQVAAASGFYTGQQMVDGVAKATGQPAKFNSVSEDTYRGFLPDGMKDELSDMTLYIRDHGYYGPPDPKAKVEEGQKIMEGKPTSWDEFVKKNV